MLENMAEAGFDVNLDRKKRILIPGHYIGRAPEQVTEFVKDVVGPVKKKYKKFIGKKSEVNV